MTDWAKAIDFGRYGQSNRTWYGMSVHPAVFFPIALISLFVILFSVIAPQSSAELFAWLRASAVSRFNWFLLTVGNLVLLFLYSRCCFTTWKNPARRQGHYARIFQDRLVLDAFWGGHGHWSGLLRRG